jgi:hypothetical protein
LRAAIESYSPWLSDNGATTMPRQATPLNH